MTISENVTIKDAFHDDIYVKHKYKMNILHLYPESDKLDLKDVNYLLENDSELYIIVKSGIKEIEILNLELIKDYRLFYVMDETKYLVTVNSPDIDSIHLNNIKYLYITPNFKIFVNKTDSIYTTSAGLSNISIKEIDILHIYLTKDELQNEATLDFKNIENVSNLHLGPLRGVTNLKCNPFLRFYSNSELRIDEIFLHFYIKDTFYLVADDILDIQTNYIDFELNNICDVYFINVKVSNITIEDLRRKGYEVFTI